MGGDHSITLPELRAIAAEHGPVGLIQLDAHTDTDEEFLGLSYTHSSPFYHAAREGLLDPKRVIQAGVRGPAFEADEYRMSRELGFEVVTACDCHNIGMKRLAERIRDRVGQGPVFLTFDIDVVDPAFAPATGFPEVGGLASWQILELLRGLRGIHFVGFDVVEVIPAYDSAQITAILAANVMFEFLVLLARQRTGQ